MSCPGPSRCVKGGGKTRVPWTRSSFGKDVSSHPLRRSDVYLPGQTKVGKESTFQPQNARTLMIQIVSTVKEGNPIKSFYLWLKETSPKTTYLVGGVSDVFVQRWGRSEVFTKKPPSDQGPNTSKPISTPPSSSVFTSKTSGFR